MRKQDGTAVDTEKQRLAREHYNTRASRRLKSNHKANYDTYDQTLGTRLPGNVTLALRREIAEDAAYWDNMTKRIVKRLAQN